MFCCCQMYSSIVWNPASSVAAAVKVYYHSPYVFCLGSHPISRRATCYWNRPQGPYHTGVTIQVSVTKSNTACTADLKKNPDTCGSDPSLLMIFVIIFHTALAHDNLLTTTDQSLSAAEITCPRYWKEFTISRGIS